MNLIFKYTDDYCKLYEAELKNEQITEININTSNEIKLFIKNNYDYKFDNYRKLVIDAKNEIIYNEVKFRL